MTSRDKFELALFSVGLGALLFALLAWAVWMLRVVLLRGLPAVVVVFVLVVPAHAQDRMPLKTKVALGCFAVGSYWDAVNTAYWSAKGKVHEANPLYRPVVRRYGIAVTMTIKGGGNSALAAGVIAADRRGHDVAAFWSAAGLCAGQTAVNIGNARRMRQTR